MAKKAMPTEERDWRAESDAETLINAAEIEKDSARKKLAVAKARKMAADAEKRAKAARQVAKRAPVKNKPKPKPKPKPRGRHRKK
jgi:hypothetical protein